MDLDTIKACFDWITFLTVIGTGATVVGMIYGFLRNFKADLNSHIDRLEGRMDKMDTRLDSFERRMDQQNARIDQLYTMFIDLLKEGRKPQEETK